MEVTVVFNLDKKEVEQILAVHKDLDTFVVKACEAEAERILKLSEVKKEEVKDGTSTKKDGS